MGSGLGRPYSELSRTKLLDSFQDQMVVRQLETGGMVAGQFEIACLPVQYLEKILSKSIKRPLFLYSAIRRCVCDAWPKITIAMTPTITAAVPRSFAADTIECQFMTPILLAFELRCQPLPVRASWLPAPAGWLQVPLPSRHGAPSQIPSRAPRRSEAEITEKIWIFV